MYRPYLHGLILLGEDYGQVAVLLLDLADRTLDKRHESGQPLAHRELGVVPLEQPNVLPRRHPGNLE